MSMRQDDSVDLPQAVLGEELEGGREKGFAAIDQDRPINPQTHRQSKYQSISVHVTRAAGRCESSSDGRVEGIGKEGLALPSDTSFPSSFVRQIGQERTTYDLDPSSRFPLTTALVFRRMFFFPSGTSVERHVRQGGVGFGER
jgi:hypothetical protein